MRESVKVGLLEDKVGTGREGETGDCEVGMAAGGQQEELCCSTNVSGMLLVTMGRGRVSYSGAYDH